MQSCTCNRWSSDFASSSTRPAHAGVIRWILFCPHKKPIRYRISSIFLAATFGRYNLNWSGLSVNHWDLIQLTISGIIWEAGLEKCKKSENFVIYFDPHPLDWMNIHIPLWSYTCFSLSLTKGVRFIWNALSLEAWPIENCYRDALFWHLFLRRDICQRTMLSCLLWQKLSGIVGDKIKDLPLFSSVGSRGDKKREFVKNCKESEMKDHCPVQFFGNWGNWGKGVEFEFW